MCEPNVVTYNTMITGLCKISNNVIAISLLKLMDEKGCKPNVITYSTIIDSLCKDKLIDKAYEPFKEMVYHKGIMPDFITYSSLIGSLFNLGRWEEASKMLKYMLDDGISPDVQTFNRIVNAYDKEGKLEESKDVINIMLNRGILPTIVTYSSLIDGYFLRAGSLDTIMSTLISKLVPNDLMDSPAHGRLNLSKA
ncbi:putative pentatricopeptide repeat-containing protein [Tanacetum coccineum]